MKTNKKILIVMGVFLILIGTIFVCFLPLLEELIHIRFSLFNICVGTGCEAGGGGCGVLPCPQPAWCDGYKYGPICFSDVEKYCSYAHPSESREKCRCEALKETEGYDGKYRKFCKKNTICYTNSWEYEFGCAEDMEKTCKEVENRLRTEKSCPYCETSWVERYSTLRESEKKIVGKQFKSLCTLICKNCDTTLCTKDNLCEYAVHSSNTII